MTRQIIWGSLFAGVGLMPAFFLDFATIFTDAGAPSEYVLGFGLIITVYALLGFLAGYVMRIWRAGLWLSATAIIIVGLYSVRETGHLLLHISVVALTLIAACGGALGGAAFHAARDVRK